MCKFSRRKLHSSFPNVSVTPSSVWTSTFLPFPQLTHLPAKPSSSRFLKDHQRSSCHRSIACVGPLPGRSFSPCPSENNFFQVQRSLQRVKSLAHALLLFQLDSSTVSSDCGHILKLPSCRVRVTGLPVSLAFVSVNASGLKPLAPSAGHMVWLGVSY